MGQEEEKVGWQKVRKIEKKKKKGRGIYAFVSFPGHLGRAFCHSTRKKKEKKNFIVVWYYS